MVTIEDYSFIGYLWLNNNRHFNPGFLTSAIFENESNENNFSIHFL